MGLFDCLIKFEPANSKYEAQIKKVIKFYLEIASSKGFRKILFFLPYEVTSKKHTV
jgi:hypothetical protein